MRCLPVDSLDVVARRFECKEIDVTAYEKHVFGGGWVHKSVKAPVSVYIGRRSLVMEGVSFNGSMIGIGDGVKIGSRTSIGENVFISTNSKIGSKVVIGTGSCIDYKTVVHDNVRIGEWCDIRGFCNIGHHCKLDNRIQIGEYTCINSRSVIDARVFIGSHTRIGHHSTIGCGSEIGASVLLSPKSVIGQSIRIKDGIKIPFAITINDSHDVIYYTIGGYVFTFLPNGMCYCADIYDCVMYKFNTHTEKDVLSKKVNNIFGCHPSAVRRYFACLEKSQQFFRQHKRAKK